MVGNRDVDMSSSSTAVEIPGTNLSTVCHTHMQAASLIQLMLEREMLGELRDCRPGTTEVREESSKRI